MPKTTLTQLSRGTRSDCADENYDLTLQAEPAVSPACAAPFVHRMLRFLVAVVVLWMIIYVLAPMPLQHISLMRQLADSARAHGISPAAVYYTDVQETLTAVQHNRNTLRYISLQR